jgi:hypothetical protein
MSGEPNTTLQRAFELIEGEAYDEAKVLINSYLTTHPYDADAWWLLSHATDDPEEAASALKNVLRLNPDYPRAAELAGELESQATTAAPNRNVDADALFLEEEDDFEDLSPAAPVGVTPEAKSGGRRNLTWLLIAAAAILVIVAVFILTNRQPAEIPGSATEVAQATQQAVEGMTETVEATAASAVEDPTPEPAVEETPAEPEATAAPAVDETPVPGGEATSVIEGLANEPADAFYSALAGLGVVEGSGEVVETSKGRTLTFDVCTAASVTGLREAALEALTTMAGMSNSVQDSVDAVGVRLVNCAAENAVLRYVVVDLASAVDFSSGALSQTSFAAAWDAESSQ